MKPSRHFAFAALASLAAAFAVPAAFADLDYTEARQLRADGKALAEERVAELALQQRPGRVVELELEREHGRLVYEVEVHDEAGKEWKLSLDAATGEVLADAQDD